MRKSIVKAIVAGAAALVLSAAVLKTSAPAEAAYWHGGGGGGFGGDAPRRGSAQPSAEAKRNQELVELLIKETRELVEALTSLATKARS